MVVVDGTEVGAEMPAGAVTGAVTGREDARGPAAGAACIMREPVSHHSQQWWESVGTKNCMSAFPG